MDAPLSNAQGFYMEALREGNPRRAIDTYTGDRYAEHSTGVPDGKDGFVEFFEPWIDRNPVRDVQLIRTIADRNLVFLHGLQDINNGDSRWVTCDFFDTDGDAKLVEHWDVVAEFQPKTPSGRTNIDGETEISDRDRTDENKALVRAMIEGVLMPGGDTDTLDHYVADDYVEHSAEIADGVDALRDALSAVDRARPYQEIVLLVGEGNFVATLCRTGVPDAEFAQVDVFRVADGRIAEHWDGAEPVPEGPQPNTGKF